MYHPEPLHCSVVWPVPFLPKIHPRLYAKIIDRNTFLLTVMQSTRYLLGRKANCIEKHERGPSCEVIYQQKYEI